MLHDYTSNEASDSGQCSNADCPQPNVFTFPVSGAGIAVPTYVTLTSDIEGAIIRYTTDGTDPDVLSPEYTGPFVITSPFTVIRAIAYVEGCVPASVSIDTVFTNPSFPFVFSYACDTPDNGGQWDDFSPNGVNDHHWQLQFALDGPTTIKRLELYQLDADGKWTTGQVWSTDSPINPFTDDPEKEFACFPLLVFDTAVQQWAAYQSSLGSFGPGTITWDLYGDIAFSVGSDHLWRLDIILADDSRLSQIINTTCTVTPPLCPPPATPTLTGKCDGKVDVTLTGTVGRPYRIFVSSIQCGTGAWSQVASGTIDVSPKTVEITGLTKGCLYSFYVSIDEPGCGYRDSAIASVLTKSDALVTISTNKTVVDPGESFTISWTSSNIGTAVCGGCLAGEVSLNQGIGCKAGNTPGSIAQSQAVCGVYTYQITGCNDCNTHIASVQVEVRCLATCATPPFGSCIKIAPVDGEDVHGQLCDFTGICAMGSFPAFCGAGHWSGTLFANGSPGTCRYEAIAQGLICHYAPNPSCGWAFGGALCFLDTDVVPNRWRLTISGRDYSVPSSPVGRLLWEGEKLVGNNALGTYSRVGGCATGPSSFIITDQNCPI